MTNFEQTVQEIRMDLYNLSQINKEDLLAICAEQRITDLSDKYNKRFDKLIFLLENNTEQNFDDLSSSIKIISNTLTLLYNTLLSHAEFYYDNYFK